MGKKKEFIEGSKEETDKIRQIAQEFLDTIYDRKITIRDGLSVTGLAYMTFCKAVGVSKEGVFSFIEDNWDACDGIPRNK